MPLNMVSAGHSVVLRRVRAGRGLTARLAAMGLVPGVEVHVHRHAPDGPVVLGIAGSRVMLGRGMAHRLYVEDVEQAAQ
jgi:ferrous iron transport protein A